MKVFMLIFLGYRSRASKGEASQKGTVYWGSSNATFYSAAASTAFQL
jgi:hypothetical protein